MLNLAKIGTVKENATIQRSVLAKLLSNENINVQHGNYRTAFFDVKNRILGLPIWKDIGKDSYDMLVGHEVGHALFSPMFDPNKLPAYKACVNICEDIRIERMIQEKYLGLIGSFRRGYQELLDRDFFGIKGKDLKKLSLGDRINLHAKCGALIQVPFFKGEHDIVNQCMSVKTWDDVLAAAKALEKFMKEQKEEQEKKKEQQKQKQEQSQDEQSEGSDDSDSDSGGEDDESEKKESKKSKKDDESDEDESGSGDDSDKDDDGESNGSTSAEDDSDDSDASDGDGFGSDCDEDDESDGDKSESASYSDGAGDDAPLDMSGDITTSDQFEKNVEDAIDTSSKTLQTIYAIPPTRAEALQTIVGWKDLFAERARLKAYKEGIGPYAGAAFNRFMQETKNHVAVLIKEFELRKAAFQYSRATTSRTGTLNVNKLHSYRIDDDIFMSVSKLADAKNHGMIMLVDYSGSMYRQLPNVLKHLINLTVFCRGVGIPFSVYAFTSGINPITPIKSQREGTMNLSDFHLVELASSKMNKSQFNNACRDLFIRAQDNREHATCETLGSTPLNESLLVAHEIVAKFRAEHNVQKMNFIVLSDGEANYSNFVHDKNYDCHRIHDSSNPGWHYGGYVDSVVMKIGGRTLTASSFSGGLKQALIASLREVTGTRMIGFFIVDDNASNESIRSAFRTVKDPKKLKNLNIDQLSKSLKQNKYVNMPGAYNYDDYFIINSTSGLEIKNTELVADNKMSAGQLTNQFKKFSHDKRKSRVFLSEFAKVVS